MNITCEEKSGQSVYPEIVQVQQGDTLYFPNVDSCMSITYVLDDDSFIGGHVGWGENMQPDTNANRILDEMAQISSTTKVIKIIFIGDLPSYSASLANFSSSQECSVHKIDNPDGQADIYFSTSDNSLSINRSGTEIYSSSLANLPDTKTL